MKNSKVKPNSPFRKEHKRNRRVMSHTEKIIEANPDVKSFIYQQIAEFQQFVTPTTVAAVIVKDPLKLSIDYELSGNEMEQDVLAKWHRIAIHLKDQESEIQEEAIHENIFEAIRLAKIRLYNRLVEIQDSVISKKDRIEELYQALHNNNQVH